MEKFVRNFLWLVLIPGIAWAQMGIGMFWVSTGLGFGGYFALASYATFFAPFSIRLGWYRGLHFCFFYTILAFLTGIPTVGALDSLSFFMPAFFPRMLALLIGFIVWALLLTALGGRILEHETKKKESARFSPSFRMTGILSAFAIISYASLYTSRIGFGFAISPILLAGAAWLGIHDIGAKGFATVLSRAIWGFMLIWLFAAGIMGEALLGFLNSMDDGMATIGKYPSYFFFSLLILHWSVVVSEKYAEVKTSAVRTQGT